MVNIYIYITHKQPMYSQECHTISVSGFVLKNSFHLSKQQSRALQRLNSGIVESLHCTWQTRHANLSQKLYQSNQHTFPWEQVSHIRNSMQGHHQYSCEIVSFSVSNFSNHQIRIPFIQPYRQVNKNQEIGFQELLEYRVLVKYKV